jgi:hypothetical protein
MPEAERIFGHGLIKLGTRGAASLMEQGFVTSEHTHPVAGWRPARGDAEVGQQFTDCTASLER